MNFEPYSDGLGIMRDTQTARPQSFVTGDGWFVYNLAANLAQIQSSDREHKPSRTAKMAALNKYLSLPEAHSLSGP